MDILKPVKSKLLKHLASRCKGPEYQSASGLLIAVSGGIDSMVLLDALFRLRQVHGAELKVVYIHHQTGMFADLSEKVVKQFCERLAVPLFIETFENGSGNFEFNAASFRRKILFDMMEPGDRICLAHHRRDQVETILLSLLRGGGVPAQVGFHHRAGPYFRPLYDLDRSAIFEHARLADIPHVLDPTNQDPGQFRGSLRRFFQTSALRAYGGNALGLLDWGCTYETLRADLKEAAIRRFNAYFKEGKLPKKVFNLSEKYLWPFLLEQFTTAQGLDTLGKRHRQTMLSWLEEDKFASLDLGEKLLWVDIDGLVLSRKYEFQPNTINIGEACHWGPWIFRRTMEGTISGFSKGPIMLELPVGAGKMRELYRSRKVPHRFRHWMPVFSQAGIIKHPYEILVTDPSALEWAWSDEHDGSAPMQDLFLDQQEKSNLR